MTRIGWLVDQTAAVGGAELTQAEFRNAAPEGVEIIDCPAGHVMPGLDSYVLQNIVSYTLDDLKPLKGIPTIKYHHDVGPWMRADVWKWLRRNAQHVCCSPIQAEHMGLAAHLIPPPVDLRRFERAAEGVNGSRGGAVSVASWRNYGKAPHKVMAWSQDNDIPVDFWGGGELAPPGSQHVSYDSMPALLAQYETMVFLPTVLEPFGRVVAEAWAAGCSLVVNDLVGAKYWITEDPDAIASAASDFWGLVLRA